jgi:hypothetical protein
LINIMTFPMDLITVDHGLVGKMTANKPTKYYSGLGGVFYKADTDEIFIMEKLDTEIIQLTPFEVLGYEYDIEREHFSIKRVGVTLHDAVIRLGEL